MQRFRKSRSRRLLSLWAVSAFVGALALPATSTQAAVGAPASTARPNIVYILTDDQTMDSVAKMPYVGSRTDWITFSNATIENSECCPSRSTILSGRYDTHTHVTNNGQAGRFNYKNTIGVWLQSAGYRTALVGKFLNNYPQAFGYSPAHPFVPPGWTDWQAAYGTVTSGPNGVDDTLYSQYNYSVSNNGVQEKYGSAPSDYEVNVLADKAVNFIRSSKKSPFFLYFAPTATHGPRVASPTRTGMFNNAPITHDPSFNEANVADKPAYIRNLPLANVSLMDSRHRREWAAAVSIDDAVKQIDNQLKAQGVYGNTVEIFMTDNGYSFGDHRWVGKRTPYAESIDTPLLVRVPGLAARHVSQAVSNVDIASTVADLAGATPGLPQDGQSLVPLLHGVTTNFDGRVTLLHWPGNRVPSQQEAVPEFFGLHTTRYTYAEYSTGEGELYDHQKDPFELTNVYSSPAYAGVRSLLHQKLVALKKKASS